MDVYGYDNLFVHETPDYLKCPLCHLVMREPMLIVSCGHKFCGPCFRRLEEKTTTVDQQLVCPVDKAVVDTSLVVNELGLARAIGCLVVNCDEQPRGCPWEGELSELPTHRKKCEFSLQPPPQPLKQDVVALIARLENRIDVAEKALFSSEKEVAHMGCLIKENTEEIKALKLKDLEKTKEIDELKKRDANRTKEINELKKEDANKTKEINELKKEDANKTKEIDELKKEDANKTKEIDELKNNDANKTKEIDELKKRDANKTKQIDELKNNLAKKGEEIEIGAMSGTKPVVRVGVKRKVQLKFHRGLQGNITISPDNSVHFNNNLSTVAAPDVVVHDGEKVVYEVKVKWSGGSVRVGWATNRFTPHNNGDMYVGKCKNSWCFNARDGHMWHNDNSTQWGKWCERDGRDHVLGVALDMVRGQMLYGWDGVWDPPMGVAFNVDTHLQLFPAITGGYVDVQVNFGDTPLSFGGPDASYKSLVEM